MTIQFNLLPDIKVDYLKARRQQHLVVLAAILASVVAVVVFVLSLSVVYGVQKKTLSDLNRDIKVASTELKNTKDLNKVLTVQSQLKTLPNLHDEKVASSRLYAYLSQITPIDVTIAKSNIDFASHTMTVSGAANGLAAVNTYADTLKFTNYSIEGESAQKPAFTNVVLSAFSRNDKNATYDISLSFDSSIFVGTKKASLTVPQIISTRSEVAKPTALFQQGVGGQ